MERPVTRDEIDTLNGRINALNQILVELTITLMRVNDNPVAVAEENARRMVDQRREVDDVPGASDVARAEGRAAVARFWERVVHGLKRRRKG